jgi:hypothetical protein
MLESNPSYSQDITTRVTQGKVAVCTYFKYPPGLVNTESAPTWADAFELVSTPKRGWSNGTPLTGSFAAGIWTFKVALYNTSKYAVTVKIAVRLSRSTFANGLSAVEIKTSVSPNTIALAGTVGNIQTDSWTWNAGEVPLNTQYLFAEFALHIEVASSSNSAQHAFICDENPATRLEEIITPTFTPGGPITGWRKLQYLTEPPTTGSFNKLRFASEPPVSGAFNKLLYDGE